MGPNLPFNRWTDVFACDQALITAMLDRLLHHAHIVQSIDKSYRLRDKTRAEQVAA